MYSLVTRYPLLVTRNKLKINKHLITNLLKIKSDEKTNFINYSYNICINL